MFTKCICKTGLKHIICNVITFKFFTCNLNICSAVMFFLNVDLCHLCVYAKFSSFIIYFSTDLANKYLNKNTGMSMFGIKM